jgi:Mg-chelatase subunit ChlD
MADPKKTRIVALLDRTGSMADIKTDVEGAFDQFIKEQRELDAGDEVSVTLYQFDHNGEDVDILTTVYANKPLTEVASLTITPRGLTPLNDAIGQTIVRTGEQLARLPEDERPGKVIFVIMTDGQENKSREYSTQQVKQLIEQQRTTYSWEFHFLGVGIDAFAVAGNYGIDRSQTFAATRDGESIGVGYAAMTNAVSRSRTGS